ncbi:MAG: 50S ribosomal protein L4 [Acidimicrobiia bacterium]|nr:50S ribosomal protein L4 [Acidimicrobiia bacterium]
MPTVSIKTSAGKAAGSVDLDAEIFGIEPNVAVMHQVVTAQLAARRAGTHSTKTRSEVRGGGSKPWRQKGTGRARAGSIRSPIWIGGGIAHGPKPRNYAERTNKKMINLALRSALSDRAADDKVVVVDSWGFDKPSTKAAKAALAALGVEGRALVVVSRDDDADVVVRSFRNLPEVHLLAADQLNCYDVLVSDYVVFAKDSVPGAAAASAPGVAKATPSDEDAEASDGAAEPKATKPDAAEPTESGSGTATSEEE